MVVHERSEGVKPCFGEFLREGVKPQWRLVKGVF